MACESRRNVIVFFQKTPNAWLDTSDIFQGSVAQTNGCFTFEDSLDVRFTITLGNTGKVF